tara:strand:+ start:1549 stop:2439 length:891 start_codon:yes stop_codon:yes gene_type:complete
MDNFSKYKDLTIVIVTFYSEHIIYKCIESIGKNIKIIIVENSNNFELKKDIEKKYSNVEVILSGNNLGYGKANNLGIKHSETNFVLILNPDTLIDSNNIEILFEYAKNYKPTILAPIIKDKNTQDWNFGYFNKNINDIDVSNSEKIFEVDFVRGFALLINKNKFQDNFFDENYFTYMEELDLCMRVKREGGKVLICPKAKVSHLGASSHNKDINFEMELSRNWHWMWSNYYYYKKNFSIFTAYKKTLSKFIFSFLKMIFYSVFNKQKYLINKQRFLGLLNAYLNKPSSYKPKIKKN